MRALGDTPETTGSASAAMRRTWINLKSALGGGDSSIMEACETGEDAAVKAYKDFLGKGLPDNLHQLVVRQYESVKASHDCVKAMHDSAHE